LALVNFLGCNGSGLYDVSIPSPGGVLPSVCVIMDNQEQQ